MTNDLPVFGEGLPTVGKCLLVITQGLDCYRKEANAHCPVEIL